MLVKVTLIVFSYLLGSVCFGYVLAKCLKRKDFGKRDVPGGAGAVRQLGFLLGIIVGILDVIKGPIPILIAKNLGMDYTVIIISALAVVAGHNWPIFFHFRGGGGVAPTLGILIILMPKVVGFSCGLGLISGFIYRYRKPLYLFSRRIEPLEFIGMNILFSLPVLTLCFEKSRPLIFLAFLLVYIAMIRSFFLWISSILEKKRKTID